MGAVHVRQHQRQGHLRAPGARLPAAKPPPRDLGLTEGQCGSRAHRRCVPAYQLAVVGMAGQRLSLEGRWLTLRGPHRPQHVALPSGGRCPAISLQTSTDAVTLWAAHGQRILIRLSPDGRISTEDRPAR